MLLICRWKCSIGIGETVKLAIYVLLYRSKKLSNLPHLVPSFETDQRKKTVNCTKVFIFMNLENSQNLIVSKFFFDFFLI